MTNGMFTEILLGILAITLVVAAVIDVRTFTISNRLNASVALLAPLYWWSAGLSLWPGAGTNSNKVLVFDASDRSPLIVITAGDAPGDKVPPLATLTLPLTTPALPKVAPLPTATLPVIDEPALPNR